MKNCKKLNKLFVWLCMFLILFFSVSSKAQFPISCKDTMLISVSPSTLSIISPPGLSHYRQSPNVQISDTVPVMLLVCDTLKYTNYTPGLTNNFDKSGTIIWVIANAVRTITIEKKGSHQQGDMMWYNDSDKYYYDTEKYLDAFMRPLSKHVVIWQTILLK